MKVPEYQRSVSQEGLPNVQMQSAVRSGNDLLNPTTQAAMEGAANFAKSAEHAALSVYESQLKEANQTRAKQAVNALTDYHQNVLFGDGKTIGALNTAGEDAFKADDSGMNVSQKVLTDIRNKQDEIMAGLGNDQQRQIFQDHAYQLFKRTDSMLIQHEGQQYRNYQNSVDEADIATRSRAIRLNNNNFDQMKTDIDGIYQSSEAMAKRNGHAPDAGKVAAQQKISEALKGAVGTTLQQGNYANAIELLHRFNDHFDANDKINVSGHIADSWASIEATRDPHMLIDVLGGNPVEKAILNVENGKDNFDANGNPAVSADGKSIGKYQVTDSTASAPGFGIAPASSRTHDEYNRVGKEMIGKLGEKYANDPEKIAAAYNAGSGAVDEAIKKGGDNWQQFIPSSTRDTYLPRFRDALKTGTPADLMSPEKRRIWLNHAESEASRGQAIFAANLNNTIKDQYTQAAATGVTGNMIPEDAFHQAFGNQGQKAYEDYKDRVNFSQTLFSLKGMSQEQARAVIESARPVTGKYGQRQDGTLKGSGYLGELPVKGGGVATEYSMQSQSVQVDGKQIDFPTLVPTLTKDEVEQMVNDIIPNEKPIPDAIAQKAVDFAKQRLAQGLSVWHDTPEETINPNFDREQDQYEKLQAAYIAIDKQRKSDPIVWAKQNGYPLNDINWNNANQAATEVANRVAVSNELNSKYGIGNVLLSKDEAEHLTAALETGTEDDSLKVLKTLRTAIGDSEQYNAVIQQLRPDSAATRYAGYLIGESSNSMEWQAVHARKQFKAQHGYVDDLYSASDILPEINGTDVARLILKGERMLNPTKGNKKEDGKWVGIAIPSDFNQLFYAEIGNALNGNTEAEQDTLSAARAYYAATMDKSDTKRVDGDTFKRAMAAVTGGVYEHAGEKVIPPYGMSGDSFRDMAYMQYVEQTGDKDPIAFNNMPMKLVAPNTYTFVNGTGNKKGKNGIVTVTFKGGNP